MKGHGRGDDTREEPWRSAQTEAQTQAGNAGTLTYSQSPPGAGGGLAMVVTGLVENITAESADRVALGAGAIAQGIVAMNDGRSLSRREGHDADLDRGSKAPAATARCSSSTRILTVRT